SARPDRPPPRAARSASHPKHRSTQSPPDSYRESGGRSFVWRARCEELWQHVPLGVRAVKNFGKRALSGARAVKNFANYAPLAADAVKNFGKCAPSEAHSVKYFGDTLRSTRSGQSSLADTVRAVRALQSALSG